MKRAGIQNFRLHDQRHTFASYDAMQVTLCRASRDVVSKRGHKDPRMTMHYWHLSDGYLRAAVNGVNLGGAAETDVKNGTHVAPAGDFAFGKSDK